MQHSLTEEVQKVLNHYKNLFNYKSIYLFPDIQENLISPIFLVGAQIKEPFNHSKKISWLNFYQDVLTREHLDKHLSIADFLKYYDIDILYPIRENGNCYGFLAINNEARKVKSVELRIGDLIVSYLASFWRNLELLKDAREASDKTQTMVEEITSLLEISRALESGEDIQNLLESIIEKCMKVMNSESASLMLLDNKNNELEFKVALGPKGKEVKPLRLPVGKGIAGWVAREGRPLLIPNAYEDDRFDQSFDARTGYVTKSIICVPLLYQDKTLGVVQALNRLDGNVFTREDLKSFVLFASLAALAIHNSHLLHYTIQKEKLEKDLVVASEVQRLIIPNHLPKISSLEMSGIYIPSKGIGGDFYSVFPLNENQSVFCITDVAAKGVNSALLISTLHATLKAYLDFTSDLVLIMQKLNHLIEEMTTADHNITLFLALYDKTYSELTYVNAGHYPPFLFSKKSDPKKLKSNGKGIGTGPFEYQAEKIQIEKGEVLLMYTDGVIEAVNENGEIFGEKRLLQTVMDKLSQNCESIQDEITLRILDHCNDRPLNDDFTLFIVKRK
jgi:sigma-B regulation protein RsbU (phosphoserine phosphatase)